MDVLLVNNGTIRLEELRDILKVHRVKEVDFGEVDPQRSQDFDLIILSGSTNYSVTGDTDRFGHELEMIRTSERPIVGICFGFELIGHVYGATFREMDRAEKGILEIRSRGDEPMFDRLPRCRVFEYHRWVIMDLDGELESLAYSRDGIEATRHRHRPLYGFQFHPEMFVDRTEGHQVFNRLVHDLQAE